MLKKACASILSVLLLSGAVAQCFVCAKSDAVVAQGGEVTVNTQINAGEATPVMIAIVAENTDEATTKSTIEGFNTLDTIMNAVVQNPISEDTDVAGKIVHIGAVRADNYNKIYYACRLDEGIPSGDYYVFLLYYGSAGGENSWELLGNFEHLGKDLIQPLLDKMNGDVSGYQAAITEDITGAKVLEKSHADVSYYSTLGENAAAAFHNVLYSLRGEKFEDISALIDKFDETQAWVKLMNASDTLGAIKAYNATYWNLPVGNTDDFAQISNEEKAIILSSVKGADYSNPENRASIAADFELNLVFSLFRALETREDLEGFIKASSKYGKYFSEARKIISNASLESYDLSLAYNKVLDGNSDIKDMTDINTLFALSVANPGGEEGGSIDENTAGKPLGGGGGGGGGGGLVAAPSANDTPSVSVGATPFKDVSEENWAYTFIKRLYDEKVINGVSADSFAPNASVKRCDFVKIMVGALKMEISKAETAFSDLGKGSLYETYIMTAYEKGLINGIGDGSFGMDNQISRQDAAVMLSRMLDSYNLNNSGSNVSFSDIEDASDYAKEAIAKAAAMGIFTGDAQGRFNPKNQLSRSEACAILCRIADRIKGV